VQAKYPMALLHGVSKGAECIKPASPFKRND
jgi:hypothetical protein